MKKKSEASPPSLRWLSVCRSFGFGFVIFMVSDEPAWFIKDCPHCGVAHLGMVKFYRQWV